MAVVRFQQMDLWKIKGYTIMLQTSGASFLLSCCRLAYKILTTCYLFNEDLATAVDLEVMKQRTNVPSETAGTRDDFRARLLERDIGCVWTGLEPEYGGEGIHVIPFKRGSEVCSTFFFCWHDTRPSALPPASVVLPHRS